MLENLLQLIILFFVIIDPFVSFAVFLVATKHMPRTERIHIALLAVLIASIIAYLFLFLGEQLLEVFHISLDNFRVAGGIILGVLGAKMTLGHTLLELHKHEKNSDSALASIIATPLITGPACITAIIVSVHDYGQLVTGVSVGIVLLITAVFLLVSTGLQKLMGKTAIQVTSTLMGLITLAWAVSFVRTGLGI